MLFKKDYSGKRTYGRRSGTKKETLRTLRKNGAPSDTREAEPPQQALKSIKFL